MAVLAIESATPVAAVALADDDGVLAMFSAQRGRRHVETIVPAISVVCRAAGVALGEVAGVVVDVGPGLFTGLRVGISTAKALGLALGVPLCGASSLEVLAQAVAGSGVAPGTVVVPVVDARRGEVFAARFSVTGDARPEHAVARVGADVVVSPAELAATLAHRLEHPDGPVVLAGDGARRYGALLAAVPGVVVAGELWNGPPVAQLGLLGVARLSAGGGVEPGALAPLYLRAADTRINWQQRAVAHGVPAGTT